MKDRAKTVKDYAERIKKLHERKLNVVTKIVRMEKLFEEIYKEGFEKEELIRAEFSKYNKWLIDNKFYTTNYEENK